MNEIIKCMKERRSIRKYKSTQISDEELEAVLIAGLYAPTAGGRQGVIFLVTQNAEINEHLGKINRLFFNGRISDDEMYVSKEQPSIADDPSLINGFYGAPTVITIFGVRNFLYAESDCAVAAENIMLAAHSLCLGSCMVGRAKDTFDTDYGKELLIKYTVPENYKAVYHILLGYPDCHVPKARGRKVGRVIYAKD